MSEDTATAPSFTTFLRALLWGVACGVAAAALIGALVAIATATEGVSFRQILDAAGWAAMIAGVLAVFPIGPVGGLAGWQLYRRGIDSPWVYAAVGAIAAGLAPLLIVAVSTETMRYQTTANYAVVSDGVAQLAFAAIAAAGAFGGFMGGRALRRRAQP